MEENKHKRPYLNFALMLIVSFFIMYGVMFLNVFEMAHIHFSLTRVYMALLMVAPMALLKLAFMSHMYPNKKQNWLIGIAAVLVFVGSFIALRNQFLIADQQYMKAMIPHHSSAILTSKKASINDPEVRQLADTIIKSQEEEIAQMQEILKRME